MKFIFSTRTHCSHDIQHATSTSLLADCCGSYGGKLSTIYQWLTGLLSYTTIGVVLPVSAFIVWLLSLHSVTLQYMTDLGLVSVLPVISLATLSILLLSFCFVLQRKTLSEPLLALHLVLLIVMLYGVTTLVEQQPRFSVVYQHAGFTEVIMRTGTVDPYFQAYFNWPGFFILSAFLTQIAGYHDILSYATWSPVYFNLFYLVPMYVIFTTITTNKRIIWLGLCFFYLTNWIGQDYYSPQGLNFFLYLLLLAILLKWFKKPVPPLRRRRARARRKLDVLKPIYAWLTAPDPLVTPIQPRQRRALLASVIIIFAFMVFSHPLTPFFAIASVAALVVFRRITTPWLPVVMCAMTAGWAALMAQPYLVGHIAPILSDIGQLSGAIHANATSRLTTGDPAHVLVCQIRAIMTCAIWALACAGAVFRLRRHYRDTTYVLLATAPFPIVLVQSYGGEMLMRIYLFTLPMMAFFAAALFYTPLTKATITIPPKLTLPVIEYPSTRKPAQVTTILIGAASMLLLAGFLFTRYGNERTDYVTNAELAGVRHLYSIAPKGSLLLAGWNETAWQFQDIERYSYYVLSNDDDPTHAMNTNNITPIVRLINGSKVPAAYVVLSRSQQALALRDGLPPNALNQFEYALLASRQFVLVYHNSDTRIYQFIGDKSVKK